MGNDDPSHRNGGLSRRKGRIIAFQALYAWDICTLAGFPPSAADVQAFTWLDDSRNDDALIFPRLLVGGVLQNLGEVDSAIKTASLKWDFDRIKRVDLAILRISVY